MDNIIKITKLEEQMKQVNEKLDDLDMKIDEKFAEMKKDMTCFVRKEEFAPVKSIAFGMAGAILSAFIGAVIYLVFK